MKRIISFIVVVISLSVLITGCRNARVGTPNNIVSISITPTEKTILTGESVTLAVTANNTSITWPEKTGDTVNYTRKGNTVTWTPAAIAGTYEFTVKSAADPARTAKATVTVKEPQIVKIATSGENSYVLLNDGSLWGTGKNKYLTLGETDGYSVVNFIEIFDSGVADVFPSEDFCFVLKTDGSLWGAGRNDNGQLGLGDNANRYSYEKIPINGVVAVSAGSGHSLVLKSDGSVWAAGANNSGQLGIDDWGDEYEYESDRNTFIKLIAADSSDAKVVAVSAGSEHSLVLKDDGSVWATGWNNFGQSGGKDEENLIEFTEVIESNASGSKVIAISAGDHHSLALKADGSVWATGWNEGGRLGTNDEKNRKTFTEVIGSDSGVIAISGGRYHSLVLKADGSVWATGLNYSGQLGTNDEKNRNTFTEVLVPDSSDVKVVAVSAGSEHSLALKSDGSVWATGGNGSGQLGTTDTINRKKFSLVARNKTAKTNIVVEEPQIVKIATSKENSYILLSDGSLWGTGSNQHETLGKTDDYDVDGFIKVFDSDIADVFPGYDFCFVLKTDGSLWGTGRNNKGQLGLGNNSDKISYEKIPLDGVVAVSAGYSYSLALKADGSVWATGNNEYGRLGTNDKDDQNTFTEVIGSDSSESKVVAISAGGSHSLILKADGSVWATGANMYGQ